MTVGILLVDPQLDFFPGGALGVRDGDAIVAPINELLARHPALPLFASRDWHPSSTRHFAAKGGRWPPHCVQGTPGAGFHASLAMARAEVFDKGTDPDDDAGYSAFEGRSTTKGGRTLGDGLAASHVDAIVVAGLATDYCVKASVLDACKRGLTTFVFLPGVRAVDVQPGDGERALAELRAAGALLIT
ncbi:MAG: isochorismatase family protein [Deltaproteobacteria bacterium]|nr:isochorismatase family protein [Deltaproteobacteria bacterium]